MVISGNTSRIQLVRTLKGHPFAVYSVAFSPDGQLLASCGQGPSYEGNVHDDMVRLWRVEDGSLLRTLERHTDLVNSVAFSPDGQLLASGGVVV